MGFCGGKSCCCLSWFSGFFGTLFVGHLARTLFGLKVMVNDFEIPLCWSIVAFIVAGALSVILGIMGYKKCQT